MIVSLLELYILEHIILNGLYLKLEKNSKDISKILEIMKKIY